jgi:hypothetical protein
MFETQVLIYFVVFYDFLVILTDLSALRIIFGPVEIRCRRKLCRL